MGTAARAVERVSATAWTLSGAKPLKETSESGPLGSTPTRSQAGRRAGPQTDAAFATGWLRLGVARPFGGIPGFRILG